jgi:hypothetical protein
MAGLALLLVLLVLSPTIARAQQAPEEPATKEDVPKSPQEEAAKEDLDALARERRRTMILTPLPGAVPFGLSLNGALRGGVQWIVDPPRAKDDVFGFGALDIVVTARPTPNVTFLLDVEGVVGLGPDQALGTLSVVNAESERLEGAEKRLYVREAWVRLQTPDAGVRFNIGKLDVTHYIDRNFFAEDETRQFLAKALVTNPMLHEPPNSPAASIRVSRGQWRYALGVHAPDDVDGEMTGLPFIVGELGRRDIFPLPGHYRWWARVTSVADRRDDVTWGTGLSVDQLVADNVGVFARAGFSRSDGESVTSHAWSAGVQHSPTWLDRPKDLAGIGYSFVRESSGREHLVETYYNLSLADCCSVIVNVQWITGGGTRDAVLPGLRAVVLF